MARSKRIHFPGAVYHVIQKGNSGQNIFIDDTDRWHFLKLLLKAKGEFPFSLYCYTLMANHFHITIEMINIPISKIMQFIEGSYAMYFNKRHARHGHLFQGRFKDIIVEKNTYLLELSRYIHLNPVKAGLVALPEQYFWSSYSIYLGRRKDFLVDTKFILDVFDTEYGNNAGSGYKRFVEDNLEEIYNQEDWLKANLIKNKFLGTANFFRMFQKRGQTPPVFQK